MSQYPPFFKRPLLLAKGFETRAASTFKGNLVLSTGGRMIEHIQSLTGASTGTGVTNYGLTKIIMASGTESATAAKLVYTLDAPVTGVRKRIYVQADATEEIEVRTPTSGDTFAGSTLNSLLWSTQGALTSVPAVAELVGLSTSQWMVSSISTGITIAGATA